MLALAGTGYGISTVVSGGSPPPTGSANVWINTTAGSSPRRLATPSTFTDPAGCNSTCAFGSPTATTLFQSAYNAASCGDTVIVRDGTYAAQDIYQNAKSCSGGCREAQTFANGSTSSQDYSGCITFQSQDLNGVTLNLGSSTSRTLTISEPYVRAININTVSAQPGFTGEPGVYVGPNPSTHGGLCTAWNVHDDIVQNMSASVVNVQGASYVFIEGSSFGPHYATASSGTSQTAACITKNSSNVITSETTMDHVVFNGNTWHDYLEHIESPRPHTECFHANNGDEQVFENNRFTNCDQYDISAEVENAPNATMDYMLVQQNVFEASCDGGTPPATYTCGSIPTGEFTYTCHGAGFSLQNSIFRFNSMATGSHMSFDQNAPGTCSFGGHQIYGNILPATSCTGTNGWMTYATVQDNILLTNVAGCGTNDTFTATDPYLDEPNLDFHEANGAVSIDYVPNSDVYPSTDKDGAHRPQGSGPDAGAYER